jgi:hypothetical protein
MLVFRDSSMVERRPVRKAARIGNGTMINLGITVNAKPSSGQANTVGTLRHK